MRIKNILPACALAAAMATAAQAAGATTGPAAEVPDNAPSAYTESGIETTYTNPIIAGFHPDPSVCRVGDDYYLVCSSFHYFPGVPLFKSRDLIHWQQIGNVLTTDEQLPLKDASSWLGIYAPTIRYHEGRFYMITTNVAGGGNFLVTATDPAGPWSKPVWLKQQGIDPSLFFEDGRCYMVSNPNDGIWMCEIDPQTGAQLTESRLLWQGDGGRYPEGPHLYKKDGYYYLLISEGGTELAHHLTIARSRDIYGPYESNPDNPILTNCNRLGQSLQVQGTGHGDLVEAHDGSWWMVLLAYRNFGGSYHHLGRETFLVPVEWQEGAWPVVNGGQPVDTVTRAHVSRAFVQTAEASAEPERHLGATRFAPTTGEHEWLYIQNPIRKNYKRGDKSLRLTPHGTLTQNRQPTFMGRRQESPRILVETEVEPDKCEAGLSIYQINDGHIDLVASKGKVAVRCKLKSIDHEVSKSWRTRSQKVVLRVTSDGEMYRFLFSIDGRRFQELGAMNCSLLSTEVAGGFTGVTIGMFAEGKKKGASANFSYFKYEEQ